MRLWIVTELYYPEMTSTGYYLTKIAEGMSKHFCVKVLCGQPNYLARGKKASWHEILNGVEVFRLRSTRFDKNVIPLRVLNMISFGVSVFIKALIKFRKGDKVLVVTTPPNLPFVVAVCCLAKKASYVLLIHDNYPEVLIASGKAKPNSIFVKLINLANRWLYAKAEKVIVVGRDMLELLKRKGVDSVYIPNWAELETVEPKEKKENKLLNELCLKNHFVFLYAGNMGHPNDLESIIDCAEILKEHQQIHFIFLGDGAKREWLERQVATRELKNVTLLKPRPRTDQIDFLNACDVGIVSLVRGMWGVSVPSRTYNLLAAGKPILAIVESGSEVDLIVKEGVGWQVEPSSAPVLAETILKIFNEREKLIDFSKRAREIALERYNLQEALKLYLEVLKGGDIGN
ncbi:MAG: glycosyltransferase family 4 protein [Pyrinomonadaceae bacterium]|nr:glycosyltransferase family 4 protein [Pyrinomonadaceae bacterium]MCX7640654.1 glycosyltransferase family 4 protein [Pyrinomonadaceae bacterium]MDW8305069.1 glycosyltransferase family 4 protein [Acidobacteriota bacterium]